MSAASDPSGWHELFGDADQLGHFLICAGRAFEAAGTPAARAAAVAPVRYNDDESFVELVLSSVHRQAELLAMDGRSADSARLRASFERGLGRAIDLWRPADGVAPLIACLRMAGRFGSADALGAADALLHGSGIYGLGDAGRRAAGAALAGLAEAMARAPASLRIAEAVQVRPELQSVAALEASRLVRVVHAPHDWLIVLAQAADSIVGMDASSRAAHLEEVVQRAGAPQVCRDLVTLLQVPADLSAAQEVVVRHVLAVDRPPLVTIGDDGFECGGALIQLADLRAASSQGRGGYSVLMQNFEEYGLKIRLRITPERDDDDDLIFDYNTKNSASLPPDGAGLENEMDDDYDNVVIFLDRSAA